MCKISVITPSIRKDRLELVRKALKNQLFTDFEWIICSPFNPNIPEASWIKDDFEGGFWSLNRAYASLIGNAAGDIIVSWQDSIWAKPDALQRFVRAVEATGGVVSGVGDQYDHLDEFGKPVEKVWSDPRRNDKYGSLYECTFPDCEYNFCAFPADLIRKIGGIDIKMDHLGFGMDMYQISDRLNDFGAKFYLDQENESFSLFHGREHKEWDEKHLMHGGYEVRKQELKAQNRWPII